MLHTLFSTCYIISLILFLFICVFFSYSHFIRSLASHVWLWKHHFIYSFFFVCFACLMLLPFTSICFSFVTFFRFSIHWVVLCVFCIVLVKQYIRSGICYNIVRHILFCSFLPKIDFCIISLEVCMVFFVVSFSLQRFIFFLYLKIMTRLLANFGMHYELVNCDLYILIEASHRARHHLDYSKLCGWLEDGIGVVELILWTIKFKYSRLAVPFPSFAWDDDDKPVTRKFKQIVYNSFFRPIFGQTLFI